MSEDVGAGAVTGAVTGAVGAAAKIGAATKIGAGIGASAPSATGLVPPPLPAVGELPPAYTGYLGLGAVGGLGFAEGIGGLSSFFDGGQGDGSPGSFLPLTSLPLFWSRIDCVNAMSMSSKI